MNGQNSVFAFLIFLFFSFTGFSQVPDNPIGLNPPSLNWWQIQTDKVRVIFPDSLERQAQRVANLVHYLWENNKESVGDHMIEVPILLQNQPVISNGFVTVGPFRSEFYTTPPQLHYPTNWIDMLTIHEYRHVMQFGNSNQGITGLARSVLGSWTWGGFLGLALPRWYLEGDAVGIETALTSSGRGRLPVFDMEYRSLLTKGIRYSYEKAGAGSFNDFVPSWYPLGYYMTTYARREFGEDIWKNVIHDAVRYKGLFYPFSNSLKQRTGLDTEALYQATIQDLEEKWTREAASLEIVEGTAVNTIPKKTVTDYAHPLYHADGSVLAEKRGYDRIPAFVRIGPDGAEIRLTSPGVIFEPLNSSFSAAGNLICWAEVGFDPRWTNRTYSIIRTYDTASGLKRKLTSRTRLFSPALSPAADRIIAVSIGASLDYRLVVLDARTGAIVQTLPNPEGWFFSHPKWVEDGRRVVVLAQKDEVNLILLFDTQSGESRRLTEPTAFQITHPFAQGDFVYFSAAYTGINNIFAAGIDRPQLFQLTSVPAGAFQPCVSADGKRLLYSDFTRQGFDIRELKLENALWKPFQPAAENGLDYYKVLVGQEGGNILNQVPQDTFPVRKFNTWSGILNPHSLLPYIDPPIAGIQLLSDNTFSTLSVDAGAFYNTNEGEWSFLANLSYAEFYPIVNLNFIRSYRSGLFLNYRPENDTTIISTFYSERWAENNFGAGLALPLNLSKGNFSTRLRLSADYHRLQIEPENRFDRPANSRDTIILPPGRIDALDYLFQPPIRDNDLNTIDLRLILQSFQRRALQNINPRWGLLLDLRYRTTLSHPDLEGDVFLVRGDFYLPGLSRNHNFYINTMFQEEYLLDNYRFSNLFFYPRGYDDQLSEKVFKIGLNYTVPLWYPDLPMGRLVFLQRVRANIFYDFARISGDFLRTRNVRSTGVELGFNFRALRLLDVDLGLRYSYLFDEHFGPNGKPHQFDFLFFSIRG